MNRTSSKQFGKIAMIAISAFVAPMLAADDMIAPDVSTLRLRPAVTLSQANPVIADVLGFGDADARLLDQIGEKPVWSTSVKPGLVDGAALQSQSHGQSTQSITREQVLKRLGELGVNLSRILLVGAPACHITIAPQPEQRRNESQLCGDVQPAAGATAHSGNAAISQTDRTLADELQAHIAAECKSLGGTPQVEFERAGQDFLSLTTPPWSFAIRSVPGDKIGMREFTVVIRRDGRVQRMSRIAARVRLIKNVVVAQKPLNVGSFIRTDDVKNEDRIFEKQSDIGVDQPGPIIGQQMKRYVAAGGMVKREDLKTVDLVTRSNPVTVIGAEGGVQVRLTGVALDSGSYGDSVRVRIGDNRKERQELRGMVTGLATVQLHPGGSQ